MSIERPHHHCPFMSTFDSFDHGMDHFFQDFDQLVNETFRSFDEAAQFGDKAFNTPDGTPQYYYTHNYHHTQNKHGYKCFTRQLDQSNQLAPRLQKTMIAIGRSVCEWEGNTAFKSTFDSYFRKLENHEKCHSRRPQVFADIQAGAALVNQAADAYAAISSLYSEVRSRQNELKLQAPSDQRQARLQTLDEIVRALDQSVLPEKLTAAAVATYAAQAHALVACLRQRMDDAKVASSTDYQRRQDVQITDRATKSCFNQMSTSAAGEPVVQAQPTAAPAVSQASLKAQKNEILESIDHAMAAYHTYFNQAAADGIHLKNFEDLRHMRLGFWETQKALAKNCFTLEEVLQWQASMKTAFAVDQELFKRLNLTCSYAHSDKPTCAGNLAQAGHLAAEIMRDLANINAQAKEKISEFACTPIAFDQLSALVKQVPTTAALTAKLGALEAFLLADRRSNTLLFEELAHEQRFFAQKGEDAIAAEYDAIIGAYKALAAEFDPRANLHAERLGLFVARWNQAREAAEARRDVFREKLKTLI